MITPTMTRDTPDSDLWQRVRDGSAAAFEVLVQRHQALVCAVAYNACGNLALSEDVAQETFWTAWRERAALAEPARLRGWLCGIARNLGHNARRRAARPAEAAASLDAVTEAAARTPGPAEELVSREEEALLWQTLEQIPESYREPLILFYREQQPVAEVAAALDLSVAAVKQRLSRGREMLRDQVAELVEGVLQRSRPGRGFTTAVMTGLATLLSAATKTALAGTGATASGMAGSAWKAVAATGITGAAGGVLGSLLGLLGGWFGVWLPAQTAPTKGERNFLLGMGLRMFLVSVLFTIVLVGGILMLAGQGHGSLFFLVGWMLAYWTYVLVESLLMVRGVKRIRADVASAEPNDTRLRAGLVALTSRFRGRIYRSRATFLGLPLIDVNVSDPLPSGDRGCPGTAGFERRKARGWIAIGDDARGILLAVGSTAWGFVAVGGRAVGVLSFGGIAVGLVSLGGLAIGGLALGGFALGGLAIGGLAIGWQACGGGAFAWDVACGGAALAYHAAIGGAAFAHDFAVGGHAEALHANDEAARALLLGHPLVRGFQWYMANMAWLLPVILLPLVLWPAAMLSVMYRREKAP